ncbi:hypothetical protein [Microbacterium algeriense]|uniref:hypothetical protein n=1 Tax=Microbacterium algeriense TaxID=2615184 RepID=UPI003D73B353
MTLPPAREWWSRLSPEARREVLDSASPRLEETVREEIREVTGAVVGMVEELTADDLDYVRAHAEPDD